MAAGAHEVDRWSLAAMFIFAGLCLLIGIIPAPIIDMLAPVVNALVAERVWQELARGLMEPGPSRMLAVLRECGALAQLLPQAQIDLVEIDPAVVRVAGDYFSFHADERLHVYTEDGRSFVRRTARGERRYDLIMLDAYDHQYIPEHMLTEEFLREVRSLLGNTRGSGQTAKMSRYGTFSLHAKLFVFDRQQLFVGSMNFDKRSRHLNTEVGLIIDSPELASQAATRFEFMTSPPNSYALMLLPRSAGSPRSLSAATSRTARTTGPGRNGARSSTSTISRPTIRRARSVRYQGSSRSNRNAESSS